MQNFGIPRGMRDILIDESSRRAVLRGKLLHYMQSCGFNQVETPIFEYHGLFSGGISPIDDEDIIKTIDRDGKIVVLRPDMTIPTARIAATGLKDCQRPLKLFYGGNVYRMDRKSRGTGTEICQVGAEIYGGSGMSPDLEIMAMAKDSFHLAGVLDYKIDIGHVGIVKGVFEDINLPEEDKMHIINLIREKNLVELEREVSLLSVDTVHKEIICKLPQFFGKPEEVFERINEIAINETARNSVDYLYEMFKKCSEMGLGHNLIIDAGMIGNMKYYTGFIFRGYARGTGSAVISGGRYDDLLEKLGEDSTAAGFAIYIDGMIEAAKGSTGKGSTTRENRGKLLVIFDGRRFIEALEYSEGRRKEGMEVNMISREDISNPERYCEEYGYGETKYLYEE